MEFREFGYFKWGLMQWVLWARQENGLQGESPVWAPCAMGWQRSKSCPICPSDTRARLGSPQGSPSGRTRMPHLTRAWGSQQQWGLDRGHGDKTCVFGNENKLLHLWAEQWSIHLAHGLACSLGEGVWTCFRFCLPLSCSSWVSLAGSSKSQWCEMGGLVWN